MFDAQDLSEGRLKFLLLTLFCRGSFTLIHSACESSFANKWDPVIAINVNIMGKFISCLFSPTEKIFIFLGVGQSGLLWDCNMLV